MCVMELRAGGVCPASAAACNCAANFAAYVVCAEPGRPPAPSVPGRPDLKTGVGRGRTRSRCWCEPLVMKTCWSWTGSGYSPTALEARRSRSGVVKL
jgi:hypothetical protein